MQNTGLVEYVERDVDVRCRFWVVKLFFAASNVLLLCTSPVIKHRYYIQMN